MLSSELLAWYAHRGRAHLPWRADPSPYRVVVSEFMLQQTQVERVIPTFERFIARFQSFAELAGASRADVVRAWKGLGYNSRAVRLHELARAVRDFHAGHLPSDETALRALAGVGPYTARAIRAFAFNADTIAIDTNVRRIVHRIQFGCEHPPRASARELDAIATALVPPKRAFEFNSALMDLGATVCTARAPRCLICPLRKRCAAAPLDASTLRVVAQKRRTTSPSKSVPFERTNRFLRGRVVDRLRAVAGKRSISLLDLHAGLRIAAPGHDSDAIESALDALLREGLIERSRNGVRLRT
jgi:A/G-specific adenine glycosylase